MVSIQQQSFPITEARVISHASTMPNKTSPKSSLILLAAIVGGSILAWAVAVLADIMDRAFRTVSQVEQLLHTNCLASVPAVERLVNKLRAPAFNSVSLGLPLSPPGHPQRDCGRLLSAENSVGRYVINSPFSRFAEEFRSVKLASDLGSNGTSASNKVLGITSALPNEGKSTISEALAQTVAQSGSRTLLVDGDIRNPSLTARLTPAAKAGLIEVVLSKFDWKDVVWVDPQTNLHFLPCVMWSGCSNSSDVLASPQMEKLFQELRESYDRIVLDLSPLAPVIDVRATGGLTDSYILVIEWAKTKVDIVERLLNDASIVRERLLGVVLNKVNMAAMSRYDTYGAGYYRNRHYKRYGYND
jgi:succinoglycan biosynthesis transport protein ExoP